MSALPQDVLVIGILAAAAGFLLRRAYQRLRGGDRGAPCAACPANPRESGAERPPATGRQTPEAPPG